MNSCKVENGSFNYELFFSAKFCIIPRVLIFSTTIMFIDLSDFYTRNATLS